MRTAISISPLPTRFGPTLHEPDVRELCRGLAAAGFNGVELSLVTPGALTPDLAAAVSESGLEVLAIATGQSYIRDRLCLYTRDEGVRAAALDRLQGFIPLARKYGCPIIVGGVRGNEAPEPGDEERLRELGDAALRQLAQAAAAEGVSLLLEAINRYEVRYYRTVESAARYVSGEHLSNVKVLADTFHMNIEEVDLVEAIQSNLAHIGYVHVADSNRLYPGAGHTDFARVLACLEAGGYDGVVGVEILPLPTPLEAAQRAMRTLQKHMNAA